MPEIFRHVGWIQRGESGFDICRAILFLSIMLLLIKTTVLASETPSSPPSVLKVEPEPGSERISPLTTFRITFNTKVDSSVVSLLKLAGENGIIPSTVIYDDEMCRVELRPEAPLENGKKYWLCLEPGALCYREMKNNKESHHQRRVRDRALHAPGNEFEIMTARMRFCYTVENSAREPFFPMKYYPLDGQKDVEVNVRPWVLFSLPVDKKSIDSASVLLLQKNGKNIPGRIEFGENGRKIIFHPCIPLASGMNHTVIWKRTIRSERGTGLERTVASSFVTVKDSQEERKSRPVKPAAGATVTYDFTEDGPYADSTDRGFKVVEVYPPAGARKIFPGEDLVIRFSRPLDDRSVNYKTVRLIRAGKPVLVRFSWPDASTLKITPAEVLSEGRYELNVSSNVRDFSGIPLDIPFRMVVLVVPVPERTSDFD